MPFTDTLPVSSTSIVSVDAFTWSVGPSAQPDSGGALDFGLGIDECDDECLEAPAQAGPGALADQTCRALARSWRLSGAKTASPLHV
jgi:hypothetical protein